MERDNLLVMLAHRQALGSLDESARALGKSFNIHEFRLRQGPSRQPRKSHRKHATSLRAPRPIKYLD
jgi:hypothetical protein